MIFATIWLGLIGFIDDYLKLRSKRIAQQKGINYKKGDKDGLAGWFKILGQVVLGIVVGLVLLFNDNTKVYREYTGDIPFTDSTQYRKFQLDGKEKVFVSRRQSFDEIPTEGWPHARRQR
jgi:phospho-N-acetylmuramoyl-pentapeptide-transferase